MHARPIVATFPGRAYFRCAALFVSMSMSCLPHAGGQGTHLGPEIKKTEAGIPYVSAGVGFDSRLSIPRFSLRLVFATKTRKYLAGIDVEISPGPSGKVIRIHSDGPWLHVDLPPGRYRVKARTGKGQEVIRSFEIQKNRITQMTLSWNISDREI